MIASTAAAVSESSEDTWNKYRKHVAADGDIGDYWKYTVIYYCIIIIHWSIL